MRRNPTDVRELVLLASLLLFVAGLCLQPMAESDLFFRLKVGAEIAAHHRLLGRNVFSFTAPDHPDLDLSWVFELAAAAGYRLGGFPAVVVAKTLWIVASFAGLFALCRRRGGAAVPVTLVLAGAALVMRERFVERPHIVSFAGEVLVLSLLAGSGTWRGSWGRRLGLAVALLVWSNAHAGIFAGVMMPALAAVGWQRIDRSRARHAWALAVAAAVAAALTPVGPVGLARYLELHVRLPRLHAIDEFRPATWRSDALFFAWIGTLSVALAVWAAAGRSWGRRGFGGEASPVGSAPPPPLPSTDAQRTERGVPLPGSPDLLPVAAMALLGFLSVRFAADATLVSAPLMAMALSAGWARLPRSVARAAAGGAAGWITAAALLLMAAGPRLAAVRRGGRALDVDLDASALPLGALRFVEDNGLRERMYNDFEIGSYLLFQGYPRYRVFVDPRLPAYPEEMHRLLGSFDLDRTTWGAAMDRYGVETALLAYAGLNRRVAWWDPEEWALVFRAANTRVFVRRRARWRDLIAAREVPATFDFTVEDGAVPRPLERKPARSPVADCEWQRRLGDLMFDLDDGRTMRARRFFETALQPAGCLSGPDEAALAAWLGALEMDDRGAEPHALTHLDRALALRPGDTQTRANRAVLYERVGRLVDAAADWMTVARTAGGTAIRDAARARARRLTAP